MKGRWRQLLRSKTMYYPWRSRNVAGVYAAAKGYTVTEVMIFMAVTAAIFIMIAGTFNSRQRSNEFTTAAREMEARLMDYANDISTGYYNNPGTFSCSVVSGKPVIATGADNKEQGKNEQCILVGKVVQFGGEASSGTPLSNDIYRLYSVAGARQEDGADVEDLGEAQPTAITNLLEDIKVPPGLEIGSLKYTNGGASSDATAIGFFTTFGNNAAGRPDSLSVDVIALTGNDIPSAIESTATAGPGWVKNPSGGMEICLNGTSVNQHVILKIGNSNSRLSTDLVFNYGGHCI